MKGFNTPPTTHAYFHPLAIVEAVICLTLNDRPKEFIMAIKFLLQKVKYLDQHFGLAPLKNLPSTQIKIIVLEDNIPSNVAHLGQYALTSGNHIFEKKKNWKDQDTQIPHQDNKNRELKDPVVYFTIAIATDLQPGYIINGIKTEWETHGGGKLQVKDLQSHESKVLFTLYFVYKDMPFYIIKKTLNNILLEAAEMSLAWRMLYDDVEYVLLTIPQISIHPKVPHLMGVDT
jgi:hypothetical protein